MFRLRTGHDCLDYLYSKFRFGHSEQCPCITSSQTTEHLLQSCPIYELLGIRPDQTPLACKLYGSPEDLRHTVTFIDETGVSSVEREEDLQVLLLLFVCLLLLLLFFCCCCCCCFFTCGGHVNLDCYRFHLCEKGITTQLKKTHFFSINSLHHLRKTYLI